MTKTKEKNLPKPKTKSEKCYREMINENPEIIAEFEAIHKKFTKNPDKFRKDFNEVGERFLEVVNKYETILCGKSVHAGLGNLTGGLSDIFRRHIRERFSEFDEIGML